jgi:hypothetical protein
MRELLGRYTDSELGLMALASNVLHTRATQTLRAAAPNGTEARHVERPPKPWKEMTSDEARAWMESRQLPGVS